MNLFWSNLQDLICIVLLVLFVINAKDVSDITVRMVAYWVSLCLFIYFAVDLVVLDVNYLR